jgi:hypothetical protein
MDRAHSVAWRCRTGNLTASSQGPVSCVQCAPIFNSTHDPPTPAFQNLTICSYNNLGDTDGTVVIWNPA